MKFWPCLPLAFVALTLSAAAPPEEEPGAAASTLLPPDVVKEAGGALDEQVEVGGFLGRYTLRTEFGAFVCEGNEMVAVRTHEAAALRQIDGLSRSKLFADAAKNALVAPIQSAVKVVKDPVAAAKAIPQGVGRLFGSVKKGAQAVGRTASNAATGNLSTGESGNKAKLPGVEKARLKWAAEFKVDPYTTNSVLARKLSDLASMSFTTETIAGFGVSAVAAPLAMVGTVDDLVLTKPPAEVKANNRGKLQSLTGSSQAVSAFLGNKWYTPTLQTRFTRAVGRLGAVKKLAVAVQASAGAASEGEARFFCRVVESLASAHAGDLPLAELQLAGRIPVGVQADGSVVVAAPVDQIAWTEATRNFAAKMSPEVKVVLLTSANVTDLAKKELAALNWTVR